MRSAIVQIAAVLALVGTSAGADWPPTTAAFVYSPLPSRRHLWSGCLAAARRPEPALDWQMARGGGRKGAGRGGARGGGAAQGVPAGEGGADRGGKGSRQGKSKLNQLLTVKDRALQAGGPAVSAKMQDFDPKTMERGTVRFLGSFDADPPKIGLPEVFACGMRDRGSLYDMRAQTPLVRTCRARVRMHLCLHVWPGARTAHARRMRKCACTLCIVRVCVCARACVRVCRHASTPCAWPTRPCMAHTARHAHGLFARAWPKIGCSACGERRLSECLRRSQKRSTPIAIETYVHGRRGVCLSVCGAGSLCREEQRRQVLALERSGVCVRVCACTRACLRRVRVRVRVRASACECVHTFSINTHKRV